ncbi:MAG: hypothetical protein RLY93_10015 [Sumerlaeia bacterium]
MEEDGQPSSAFAYYAQTKSFLPPRELDALMTDSVAAAASGWDSVSSPTELADVIEAHRGSLELLRQGAKATEVILPAESAGNPAISAFLNAQVQELLPLGALLIADAARKASEGDPEGARQDAWAALEIGDDLQIPGAPLPLAMAGTSLESYGLDLLLRLGAGREELEARLRSDRDPAQAWTHSLPMMSLAVGFLTQLPAQFPAGDEARFRQALSDLEAQFGGGRFAQMSREEFDQALRPTNLKPAIERVRSAAEAVAAARAENGTNSPEAQVALTSYKDTLTSAIETNPFVMVVAPPRLEPILVLAGLVRAKLLMATLAATIQERGEPWDGDLATLDVDPSWLIDPITNRPFVAERIESGDWVLFGLSAEDLAARGLLPETIRNYLPLGRMAIHVSAP